MAKFSQRLLAYTADTGWFGELPQYCQGAKILLAEASLKEQELGQIQFCKINMFLQTTESTVATINHNIKSVDL